MHLRMYPLTDNLERKVAEEELSAAPLNVQSDTNIHFS